ncbi:class I SAM-dependent methyltransferase [Paenibacillus sp. y28]|uniref:class I SAM-dependent methyltransferase n=1 Tax=Paenibacillus sp. y28 TaxID=3129110 RepID=UPI00301AF2C7
MFVFFDKVILPLLKWAKPQQIIEIGSDTGKNTFQLLQYCQASGARLIAIDPAPSFDVTDYRHLFQHHFHMICDYSLNALPFIGASDFILIDGDHNWYTVYHELKMIESMALAKGRFPVIILHDTSWPYGRRDMYYFPKSIPPKYTKPFEIKGVAPGVSGLVNGGFNNDYCHAVYEYGERNGVLTAVEDFLQESEIKLEFLQLYTHHGIGILFPYHESGSREVKEILLASSM